MCMCALTRICVTLASISVSEPDLNGSQVEKHNGPVSWTWIHQRTKSSSYVEIFIEILS